MKILEVLVLLVRANGSGRDWKARYIDGYYLSRYVRKPNASGSAFCIYCNKPLFYGHTDNKIFLNTP